MGMNETLKAISDPVRRDILSMLKDGRKSAGEIAEKFANSVIIDVQGVGYEISLTSPDYDALNLNDTVKVYTYHHVREQSEELFGFTALEGKKLFELLITVQGIGPKAAMSILSLGSYEEVRNAMADTITQIIDIIRSTLEKTPPELAADIMDRGITLTGGGALLRGFAELVAEETGMPVSVAANPLDCVVLGTAKRLEANSGFENYVFRRGKRFR